MTKNEINATTNVTRNVTNNTNTNNNAQSSYVNTNTSTQNRTQEEDIPYTGASDNIMRAIFVVLVMRRLVHHLAFHLIQDIY